LIIFSFAEKQIENTQNYLQKLRNYWYFIRAAARAESPEFKSLEQVYAACDIQLQFLKVQPSFDELIRRIRFPQQVDLSLQ